MALRDKLERHRTAVGVCVGVAVVAAVLILLRDSSGTVRPPTQAFYSDDDGKTVFVDSIDRLPPFDHNGKPAVRAMVLSADGGKTRFVGYLQRYTPAALKKLGEAAARPASPDKLTPNSPDVFLNGTEVKRPGDGNWVSPKDMRQRMKVTTVEAPGGGRAEGVGP